MMKMNTNPEWLRRMAEKEEGQVVSVGGWVQALKKIESSSSKPTRPAFTRLLQLTRREKSLSLEEFARQADIDLTDLLSIEHGEEYTPTPRTVHKIAKFLGLPAAKLMVLAGLAVPEDVQFSEAVVRFAARSEPVQKLTREEHEALEEFVSFLNER